MSTNFVSVSFFIVFIIFPPLPIIRPIKLLCARTFKTISIEEKGIENQIENNRKIYFDLFLFLASSYIIRRISRQA
jgi:uncharacterized membrane protein